MMGRRRLSQLGLAFTVSWVLVRCGGDAPEPGTAQTRPSPAIPLSYDYLTKLPLAVGDLVVDDAWTPGSAGGEHVEDTASPPPAEALARMLRDRLVAGGGPGRALASIDDASLLRSAGQLVGSFAVRITFDGQTAPLAPILATVSGTRVYGSDSDEAGTANALVQQLMDAMNVELEFQVRRRGAGIPTPALPNSPSAVQIEDLAPPTPPAP